jgi:thioester reductase-like protein
MPRSSGFERILFTGFPGFIGFRLIPRLLETKPRARLECLVQEKFIEAARASLAELQRAHAHVAGRVHLVVGDITQPRLGLAAAEARALQKDLVEAFHLAAVYDLAVSREVGRRINVEGTANVLSFVGEAKRFERLQYVSTAYVSGRARGVFRETDLDVGQSFKNFYEETKFAAEVAVVRSGLPATIYRPGIVVGDSKTGETGKFDGPYAILRVMDAIPSGGPFFKVGSGRSTVNIVPWDFVIEAMARLAARPASRGKTYHLTDPDPLPAFEVAQLFARALGKRFRYVPVPLSVAKLMFAPGPVRRFFDVPVQSLDYFDDPCRHDAAQATRDLKEIGVACPRLPDYLPRLVDFYRAERDRVRRSAMV